MKCVNANSSVKTNYFDNLSILVVKLRITVRPEKKKIQIENFTINQTKTNYNKKSNLQSL